MKRWEIVRDVAFYILVIGFIAAHSISTYIDAGEIVKP